MASVRRTRTHWIRKTAQTTITTLTMTALKLSVYVRFVGTKRRLRAFSLGQKNGCNDDGSFYASTHRIATTHRLLYNL